MSKSGPVSNLTTDLQRYNNAIVLANTTKPYVKDVVVSSIVFSSILVLLAVYLIYKSFKVRQRNFFIFTGLLAIFGAVSSTICL